MRTALQNQIVISTDFGLEGPYIGQMKSVLAKRAPEVTVIDLFSDLPPFKAKAAAYLIAAYAEVFDPGTVFLSVVDPGVGSDRVPIAILADGKWFVGPDNGLFEPILRRAQETEVYRIVNRYGDLSASFHGRDLFAPFAADLAMGFCPDAADRIAMEALVRPNSPDDLAEIVYIDRFGNAMTGMRGSAVSADATFRVAGVTASMAKTFADVAVGSPFWYVNSNGLVEIAVNQGRADTVLRLEIGTPVQRVTD